MRDKTLIVLVTMSLIAGWFYWSQYRPSKILSYCSWYVMWEDKGPKCSEETWSISDMDECYNLNYKTCLHDRGL